MPGDNFASTWLARLAAHDDRVSLCWKEQDILNHELHDRVMLTVADLSARGMQAQDRVLLRAEDSAQWLYHVIALIYLGAVPVILSPLYLPTRVREIFEQCGCRFMITDSADPALIELDLAVNIKIDRDVAQSVQVPLPHVAHHGDLGLIISSSGSTGATNKLVTHRHEAWRSAIDTVADIYHYHDHPGHTVYATSRLSFQYAWHHVLSALEHGHRVVLSPRMVLGHRLLNLISHYKITRLVTTPRVLATVTKLHQPELSKLDSLVDILSSGEPLPESVEQHMLEKFGHKVYNGQGSAEIITYWCAQTALHYRFGTMGRVVPGALIRLVDNFGRDVGLNAVGEIWVKMPTVAMGYLDEVDNTQQQFDQQWFKTNDMAIQDDQGFYHHIGRKNNVRKINGLFVSPTEIESAIMQLKQVEDCMVAIHEINGRATVIANIIKSHNETCLAPGEIRTFLHTVLESYKVPRIIKYVSDLPKTVTGKKISSRIEV